MQMIMKAEVFKNGKWEKVGNVFKSAIDDNLMTDRVFDGRDHILNEILGYEKTCNFEHTPIEKLSGCTKVEDTYMVTLSQLMSYNWVMPMSKVGLITEWQYKRLKQDGIEPVNKITYVIDKKHTEIVDTFEMDKIISDNSLRDPEKKYYIKYYYDSKPLSEWCNFFCHVSLPALLRLISFDGPKILSEIRIVYSFVES